MRQSDKETGSEIDRHADMKIKRRLGEESGRQTDRQTRRLRDSQAKGQTD
jgi:hypothetical protein